MDVVATLPAPTAAPGRALRLTRLQLTVALMLLALAVRVVGLTARPLWLDEAFSAWFSDRGWRYLWTVVPTFEAHPPFYYSLLKLWRTVLGGDPIMLRSLSVALSVGTVPVIVAAAIQQERLSPSGRPLVRAAAAGFLAAFSPALVLLGQEARPYPLLIFAFAVAILGLLRLMRDFSADEPGRWSSWILLGVGAELTLWAHGLGILYAACLGLALAPAWLGGVLNRARIGRGLAVGAAVALLYLPCLLMLAGRAQDWAANWLGWKPDMLLQLVGLYTVPTPTVNVFAAAAALAMLLLAKRALDVARGSGWSADRAILLLWLGPAALAALVSAMAVPVFLLRTLTATLVPAYLALAGAFARTASPRERGALAAIISVAMMATAIQTATRPASEQWDAVGDYLSRNVASNDRVWLYPSDTALPLGQVNKPIAERARLLPAPFPTLGVAGPIRAGWPAMVSMTPGQAARIASDPANERVPVIWLVTRQQGVFDPANDLPSALARVRRPGRVQQWGYIAVQPFYRR